VAAPEAIERAGTPPERAKTIVSQHVTPEEAGEVFSRTTPKLAVYSHVILPTATEQDVMPQTRKTYAGRVEMGEDLMVIEVGEKIEVRRPGRSSP
jgi:ribonuclease Z